MPDLLQYLAPQPTTRELPALFPSPFATTPHPLAQRAARELQAWLNDDAFCAGSALHRPGGGKMFGVLVVRCHDSRIAYLRAFSGMLSERWEVDGFVPPLFDREERDSFWPQGEAELAAIDRGMRESSTGSQATSLRESQAEIARRRETLVAAMSRRHRDNRQLRRDARAKATGLDDAERRRVLASCDEQSRADKREKRRLRALLEADAQLVDSQLRALADAHARLKEDRLRRSNELLRRIQDTYRILDANGRGQGLREIFAPKQPPGGAGDCAAPKLLGYANSRGLEPIAMAEFWWGASPISGGRVSGRGYPACRSKCGPLLPFMLEGVATEKAPVFATTAIADIEPKVVFEDPWLVIVNKPPGLLTVPGRGQNLEDSVLTRLRHRYPEATGPLLVHRLDLDTSGLLIAAKTAAMHAHLQRLFAQRRVDKRYVAWLDGLVAAEKGTVDLPLRVDLDDRPRQLYDPIHGKAATTHWRVIKRTANRTKVALYPSTGRTHQLRVHAAHALGIGSAIVGDRLYGLEGERLLLHADRLSFAHPQTGERVSIKCRAPF